MENKEFAELNQTQDEEAIKVAKMLSAIDKSNAGRLRNILLDIYKSEQRWLVEAGEYDFNLPLQARMKKLTDKNREISNTELKILTDVARATYFQFIYLLSNAEESHNVIKYLKGDTK